MAATASSLPLGTRLGEFELIGVLGEGGFSVVYVARDHSLERTVAIKEYIPGSIATRQPDGGVLPRSPKHEDTFKAGLASFINEARLLARFNHPALIHIHRVWEQNGTAYMVMQYCRGKTLRQVFQTDPALVKNEAWLKATFAPILDALELLHANNCFHRDLSPDNILLLQNGAPILLDFGAARQVIGDITQALTVILKPGFAPIEQYADDASLEQGPWTDVYGVGAVLYFLLMGKPPVASVARLVKDPLVKLKDVSELDWVSQDFREAVDQALTVHPDYRIRSIAELRDALQLPTFKPDSQFGGLFPVPSSVAPKTVSGEEAFHSESAGAPDTIPLNNNKAIAGPQSLGSASSADQKPGGQKAPASSIADRVQQKKIWLTKHPQYLLLGALGIIVLVIGLRLEFAESQEDDSTTTIAEKWPFAQNSPPPTETKNRQAATPGSAVAPAAQNHFSAIPDATAPKNGAVDSMQKTASNVAQANTPAPKGTIVDPSTAAAKSASQPVKGASAPVPAASASTPPKPATPPDAPVVDKRPSEAASAVPSDHKLPQQQDGKPSQPAAPASAQAKQTPATAGRQAASSPQKLSTVHFSVRPWGYVSINGELRGNSPPLTHVELTPGHYTVIITNPGYPPVTKEITVTEKSDLAVSHRFGNE